MEKKNEKERRIQILALGDRSAGKSAVLARYNDDFSLRTMGVDFVTRTTVIDGTTIHVRIFDTVTQDRFPSFLKKSCERAEGILIMFSLTDYRSYAELAKWVILTNNSAKKDMVVYLLGTNSDKEEKRKVTKYEAEDFAAQYKLKYYEVSARSNINIEKSIDSLVKEIISKPTKK